MSLTARERAEAELHRHARLLVRTGFHVSDALLAEVASGIEAELPGIDASVLARAWIAGAYAEWKRDAATWPDPTDHDRLAAAFAECEAHDVRVVMGAAGASGDARGVLTYAEPDVWRAIETGVLGLGLRHGSGEPAYADDPLHTAVATCLERHGLDVRPATGGLDVRMWWQRRPGNARDAGSPR